MDESKNDLESAKAYRRALVAERRRMIGQELTSQPATSTAGGGTYFGQPAGISNHVKIAAVQASIEAMDRIIEDETRLATGQ